MRNVYGLMMALVCLFVFSNTSFAQCPNGKCPTERPGQKFSQYQILPQGDCPNGKCPLQQKQISGGFIVPQGGVVIVQNGFIVPKGGLKSDCPNGKCDNCPCPSGQCEKGSCIGSAYSKNDPKPVTTVTVSKGGPFRNLVAKIRGR